MAGKNYNILVGVELDTSNIEKQLKSKTFDKKIKFDASDLDEANLTFNVANQLFRDSIEIIRSLVNEVYSLDSSLTE